MIATGPANEAFERAVADYTGGIADCRSTSSGTDGLRRALELVGVETGDEVVIPTYVCHDVADAVNALGARAVLADVGDDGTITRDAAQRVLAKRTKAIIAVHIFGNMCDIGSLKSIGLPVVEDACQAFGARSEQGHAGALGDLSVLSFHATKCLTTGEGGMVLRPHGSNIRWGDDESLSRLSDLSASLGLSQLTRYDRLIARRRHVADRYDDAFADLGLIVTPPRNGLRFRYVLRIGGDPADWIKRGAELGVAFRRGVDALLHRSQGLADTGFETAVELYNGNLSIPCYPAMSDADVALVIDAVRTIASEIDDD
jgi:perosamine synthetase